MKVLHRLFNFVWCIFILQGVASSLIKDAQNTNSASSEKDVKKYDDNIADSSMASYSTVVIHHPGSKTSRSTSQWTISDHRKVGGTQTGIKNQVEGNSIEPDKGEPAAEGGRSESYFKVYNAGKAKQSYPNMFSPKQEMGIQQVEPPVYKQPYSTPTPPQGMPHELMSALLKQQPQTFAADHPGHASATTEDESWASVDLLRTVNGYGKSLQLNNDKGPKKSMEPGEKLKKRLNKPTRGEQGSTFNVGYSIGFGGNGKMRDNRLTSEQKVLGVGNNRDVVLGKPKAEALRVHIQGHNSVWKEIQPGVEMSQEVTPKQPAEPTAGPEGAYQQHAYRISQEPPHIELLGDGQQGSVFYLNGLNQPDINTISTAGQSTFDHAHALGQSNTFDFSNAMGQPVTTIHSKPKGLKVLPGEHHVAKSANFDVPLHQPFSALSYTADTDVKETPVFVRPKNTPLFALPQAEPLIAAPPTAYKAYPVEIDHYYSPSDYGLQPPVPIQNVFIPGSNQGEGRMVQAIVIPINQIQGLDRIHGGFNIAVQQNGQAAVDPTFSPTESTEPQHRQQYLNAHHGHHRHHGDVEPSLEEQGPTQRPPSRGFAAKMRTHPSEVGPSQQPPHQENTVFGHLIGRVPHYFKQHGEATHVYRAGKTPAQLHREQALLNAIMAQEMLRKGGQLSRSIMRPPPPPHHSPTHY